MCLCIYYDDLLWCHNPVMLIICHECPALLVFLQNLCKRTVDPVSDASRSPVLFHNWFCLGLGSLWQNFSFLQNRCYISKIFSKKICNLQVFLLNDVKHISCNFPQISPRDTLVFPFLHHPSITHYFTRSELVMWCPVTYKCEKVWPIHVCSIVIHWLVWKTTSWV